MDNDEDEDEGTDDDKEDVENLPKGKQQKQEVNKEKKNLEDK